MTLANIMKLALRQLDEPIEDMTEYTELFRGYANMGYRIAIRQFFRPREVFAVNTDKKGRAEIRAYPIVRVADVKNERGESIGFCMDADGTGIATDVKEKTLHVLAEVEKPALSEAADEPDMPEYAHAALADYICYRHLSSGSLTKQSRAEFFRQSFYQQMHMLTPQGAGSVTRMKNLYTATDIRAVQ